MRLIVFFAAAAIISTVATAHADQKVFCDAVDPSPPRLCGSHFAGYPNLIQNCIKDENISLNYINGLGNSVPQDVLEDCAFAGCKAGYSKLKTIAECIQSTMSLRPRDPEGAN